jgi:hypothetical protein
VLSAFAESPLVPDMISIEVEVEMVFEEGPKHQSFPATAFCFVKCKLVAKLESTPRQTQIYLNWLMHLRPSL